jgi:hypothetical protein
MVGWLPDLRIDNSHSRSLFITFSLTTWSLRKRKEIYYLKETVYLLSMLRLSTSYEGRLKSSWTDSSAPPVHELFKPALVVAPPS